MRVQYYLNRVGHLKSEPCIGTWNVSYLSSLHAVFRKRKKERYMI